jgi:hypothetical protein
MAVAEMKESIATLMPEKAVDEMSMIAAMNMPG